MKRHAILASLALLPLAACASPGLPPGGPPDDIAPAIVRVRPESGAVNVKASSVLVHFDEVVSERPGGGSGGAGGASSLGLGAIVMVSPTDGRERVTWRRTAIEIEPRGGFRANTTYRITLLPGLADLRGNVRADGEETVFSTGSAISDGGLKGVVFDWAAGRSAPLARVEAFRRADSTFRWVTRADSLGRYSLRDLLPGVYSVRAFVDQNANRRIDNREIFDSATVTIGAATDSIPADFYAFLQDTIGPRIELVEPVDSVALRVRFDRAISLTWTPAAGQFALQREDSSAIAIGDVMPAARLDSLLQLQRAAEDSARAAADTTGQADTTGRADTTAQRAMRVVRPAVPADTTDTLTSDVPRPARPTPTPSWAFRLLQPLPPGAYRLITTDVPGLGGATRTSVREFTIREPVPTDTSGAPGARPPAARPPARSPR